MGQTTPASQNSSAVTTLARWGLPWLLSFCTHLLLFLALALNYTNHWFGYGGRPGVGGQRTFIDTSFGNENGDGLSSIGINLIPPGGGYYADDEPADGNSPSRSGTAKTSGASGSAVALAAVLSEGPGVDLAGVLPASGTALGAAGLEGGGVGSARGAGTGTRSSSRFTGKEGYARTGVFGVQGEGHKFVYVFDRSGSMDGHGGAPLAAAKAQLLASLDDLGPLNQFQIIFYNEHPRVFSPSSARGRLVFGDDYNKNQAKRFIQSITADGATAHEEALALALNMAPDVIFFLTDADEPRLTAEQMSRIEHLNRGSSINTIEFGYGPSLDPNNFLVQLARRNGGKHVYVDVARLAAAR
jgi:hypothetical protein